jgi:hypothetical protein
MMCVIPPVIHQETTSFVAMQQAMTCLAIALALANWLRQKRRHDDKTASPPPLRPLRARLE